MSLFEELTELAERATPGPWEAGSPLERNYVYGGGAHLACMMGRDTFRADGSLDEAEANAALITTLRNALPDIIAALEERDRLREAAKDLLDHPAPDYLPFHLWDNLRAALEQPK